MDFDGELAFTRRNVRSRGFDLHLGNPPYIRIQTLKKSDPELADYFKKRFHSASKGNFDLYVCFVERGMELLHAHGQLAYILPHKFFNAQYGQPLRELISKNRQLRHVVHFGDQQIFPGATNYVCLLFLAKAGTPSCRFVKADDLPEWQRTFCGQEVALPASAFGADDWNFSVGADAPIREKLYAHPQKLGSLAAIFVGNQTSADRIYALEILKHGQKMSTVCQRGGDPFEIESELLNPVLMDAAMVPYGPAAANEVLLFPYKIDENGAQLIQADKMATSFPKGWRYLNSHRAKLEARDGGKWKHDRWYAFARGQSLTEMALPKIILQVMAQSPKFCLDRNGVRFTGGGNGPYYGLRWNSENSSRPLEFLMAVMNSPVTGFCIRQISTTFHGGYWSYGKQYITQLPIPAVTPAQEKEIVLLVDWLLWLHRQESARSGTGPGAERDPLIAAYLEQWVNGLVYELFFPDELHAAGIHLFSLTADLKFPASDSLPEATRLPKIRQLFESLYHETGPLRAALFTLGTLEEVRIIEGIP